MKISKTAKNKKGFTLIEIIVVLIILAILAAAAIPSMIGFVNDARGKAYIAEARTAFVAAQATVTQMSAEGTDITSNLLTNVTGHATYIAYTGKDLSGKVIEIAQEDSKINHLVYEAPTSAPKYLVTITGTGTSIDTIS